MKFVVSRSAWMKKPMQPQKNVRPYFNGVLKYVAGFEKALKWEQVADVQQRFPVKVL